jgi:hypothetical protein
MTVFGQGLSKIQGAFWDDGNIPYLVRSLGQANACSKTENCILNICVFHCCKFYLQGKGDKQIMIVAFNS